MTSQRTHATRPGAELLRHTCTLCGGCCEGVRVPLYNADEEARARSAGAALGVPGPIDGGFLRFEDGQCVFLGDDGLCRIHAELGADRKPTLCDQFPLIVLSAGEEELRVGVDPASYGSWSSWRDGEVLGDTAALAASTPAPDGQEGLEVALVRLCEDPAATLTGLLCTLTRETAPPGHPPPGFATRWAQRLHQADLTAFLGMNGVGPALQRNLGPLARASRTWGDGPPVWEPLDPELDAWAVEATRRVLWLRLQNNIPNLSVAALFLLGGALAAAWADREPATFHRHHTAWLRALRFDPFWKTVAGDSATLLWLGTGRRA